jgi:hypothetical protein
MRTTGSGTELSHRQPKWMARLSLALLLLATIVQATHLCGSGMLDANHTPQFRALSSSGPVCLICLMAQPATAAVLFVSCFSNLPVRSRVGLRGMIPRLLLESFQLYVRPPPAY